MELLWKSKRKTKNNSNVNVCIQEERKKSEVQIAEVVEAGLGKSTYQTINVYDVWFLNDF